MERQPTRTAPVRKLTCRSPDRPGWKARTSCRRWSRVSPSRTASRSPPPTPRTPP